MVSSITLPPTPDTLPTTNALLSTSEIVSLEDFILSPPEYKEWVDGTLIEKTGMTAKHGLAQANLSRFWGTHIISSGQGGKVFTETLCRTAKQARRPDVGYFTAELIAQIGINFTVFPQTFSLIAEVASPDDKAEELLAKAREYLESGCQEVWLLFPENRLVLIKTQEKWYLFNSHESVSTQAVLTEFSVAVNELFD